MRESIFFTFDGISSEDMGMQLGSPNGGLYEEIFLPNRTINETKIKGRKPYFKGVESEPLSFSLSFFIYDWQSRDNLRQIARWFYQDYYKPFYFNDTPNRIYYVIVEGDSRLFHNGIKEGYTTLNFRCDSAYSYAPVEVLDGVEATTLLPATLNLYADSDLDIKPTIRVKSTIANGAVSITNSTTNETMTLNSLSLDEEVYINCETESIISSNEYVGVYRYENHNDVWISLAPESNELELVGDFTFEIEYEGKYLAE